MLEKIKHFIEGHLQWQILLPMVALLVIGGTIGVYIIYYYFNIDLNKRLITRAKLAAHSIQYASESSSTMGGIQRFVAAIGAEEDFNFVVVITAEENRIISSTRLNYINQRAQDLGEKIGSSILLKSLEVRKAFYIFNKDEDIFQYAIPIFISNITRNGLPLGKAAIIFELNTEKLTSNMLARVIFISTLFGAMLFSFTAVLFILIRYYILIPQKKLLTTIIKRQQGDKSLVKVKGHNELSRLNSAFNLMMQEADKIEKIKNEFISTVSHELRTPLTSIRGSLGLIQGYMKNNIPEDMRELISVANKNCERLIYLVNDILDIEKISSGNMEFDFQDIDLVSLAKKAIDINANYAVTHNISLKLSDSPECAYVIADENRMLQVFSNLLSNAIKFSDVNGKIEIFIIEKENNYQVSIKDYGRGIPEEFRNRIFQRFAQADSSDTRDQGGTGLGLNICKLIMDRHSGTIDYLSEVGVGTEFILSIPRSQKSANSINHNKLCER